MPARADFKEGIVWGAGFTVGAAAVGLSILFGAIVLGYRPSEWPVPNLLATNRTTVLQIIA